MSLAKSAKAEAVLLGGVGPFAVLAFFARSLI